MATLDSSIYREASPPYTALAIKRFAYGAGSALLMFAGAGATSEAGSEAWTTMDMASVDGIAQSFFDGPLNGPMQIAAAIALFLAAGRCPSRVAGLAAVAAFMTLHANGVTANDIASFLEHFYIRLSTAGAAFLNAEV